MLPGSSVIDLQSTWGAAFIGQLFNTMLTGVELVQIWLYCWNYWRKDDKTFKVFVGSLIVVDMMSTITGAYSMYWFLVVNYGDVQHFGYRLWAETIQTILNAIPGFAVQLYYARRLYLVSQRIILPIILVPIILAGTFFEFFITAKAAVAKENSKVHLSIWYPRIWIGTTVLADIFITVTMSWALYRRRTGFPRTDSMIKSLVAYTLNSGLLLSAMGSAMLISFVIAPLKLYYVVFFVVLSKCYMNSFLAMLNTRDYIRDRSTTGYPSNTFNLSSIRLESPSETHGYKSRQSGVAVTVHRSTRSE